MLVALFLLLAAVGAVLLVWGLHGRSVDDHPLCDMCGFDLVGHRGDGVRLRPGEEPRPCPECGARLDLPGSVRIGHRARRPRLIVAGVSLLVVAGTPLAVVAGGVDVQRRKPTGWLLWEMSRANDGGPGAREELLRRAFAAELSPAQTGRFARALLDACEGGAGGAGGEGGAGGGHAPICGDRLRRLYDAGLLPEPQRSEVVASVLARRTPGAFPLDEIAALEFLAGRLPVEGFKGFLRDSVRARLRPLRSGPLRPGERVPVGLELVRPVMRLQLSYRFPLEVTAAPGYWQRRAKSTGYEWLGEDPAGLLTAAATPGRHASEGYLEASFTEHHAMNTGGGWSGASPMPEVSVVVPIPIEYEVASTPPPAPGSAEELIEQVRGMFWLAPGQPGVPASPTTLWCHAGTRPVRLTCEVVWLAAGKERGADGTLAIELDGRTSRGSFNYRRVAGSGGSSGTCTGTSIDIAMKRAPEEAWGRGEAGARLLLRITEVERLDGPTPEVPPFDVLTNEIGRAGGRGAESGPPDGAAGR